MQKHHHELTAARDRIAELLADEEAKFERTLANGLAMITEAIDRAKAQGQRFIDGDTTFRLYDTYGFPVEMTREIAASAGLSVDEDRFRDQLEAQRTQPRERGSSRRTR
jgi:alanyl-tRNA synthetase